MIYPTLHTFNAPYRGPKNKNEINKLLTSIIYDLYKVGSELDSHRAQLTTNHIFCVNGSEESVTEFPTAGTIDGTDLSYVNIGKFCRDINALESRIDQILENI